MDKAADAKSATSDRAAAGRRTSASPHPDVPGELLYIRRFEPGSGVRYQLRFSEIAGRVESQLGARPRSLSVADLGGADLAESLRGVGDRGIVVFDLLESDSIRELLPQLAAGPHRFIIAPLVGKQEFQTPEYARLVNDCVSKRIFLAYPEQEVDSSLYVSIQKVVDSIICHVHRPKFSAIRATTRAAESEREAMISQLFDSMREAGRWVDRQGLLSDPFDGTVTVRTRSGVAVLGTRTRKADIREEDLLLMRSADPATGVVEYVGPRLPSSDSLCDALVLSKRSDVDAMIHTHCKSITYSPHLADFRTKGYAPYGTVELAQNVLSVVGRGGDFVVMMGHGETALAPDLHRCKEILDRQLRSA